MSRAELVREILARKLNLQRLRSQQGYLGDAICEEQSKLNTDRARLAELEAQAEVP